MAQIYIEQQTVKEKYNRNKITKLSVIMRIKLRERQVERNGKWRGKIKKNFEKMVNEK